MKSRCQPFFLASGIISLFIVILFVPYLFFGKTIVPADMLDTMTLPFSEACSPPQAHNHYVYDAAVQTIPYKTQTAGAIKKGNLHYWNPYILGGYPQYAASLGNNFDITNILLFVTSPSKALELEIMLELIIAGIGMFVLLRSLGYSVSSSILFGIAYALNTLFIATALHKWLLASFCWMPWCVERMSAYLRGAKIRDLAFSSVFLALSFLGGSLQTAAFSFILLLGFTLSYRDENSASLRQRLARFTYVFIGGFLLSMIMWLPTLELFFNVVFQGGSLNSSSYYETYSFTSRILSLFLTASFYAPQLAGGAQTFGIKNVLGVDMNDFNGGIGFLPMFCGSIGLLYAYRRKPNLRPFAIIVLLGFLLPIATPLFPFLYHRFFIVATLGLCILGADVFDDIIKGRLGWKELKKFFIIAAGICVIMLLSIGIWQVILSTKFDFIYGKLYALIESKVKDSSFGAGNENWMLGRVGKTLSYFSISSPAMIVTISTLITVPLFLFLYLKQKITRRSFVCFSVIITFLQLGHFAYDWLPSVDVNRFPLYPEHKVISYLREHSKNWRFVSVCDRNQDRNILPPNISGIYGISDLRGYESMTCRSFSAMLDKNKLQEHVDARLLGLASVKYIVASKHVLLSNDLTSLFETDSLIVLENKRALPRAYMVYTGTVMASDEDVTKEMLRDTYDGKTGLFTSSTGEKVFSSAPDTTSTTQVVCDDNESVSINASTASPGYLILTDTYYPGWKCFVNGDERPIVRVNYCMRAVKLASGRSLVEFRFEPTSFSVGAYLSLASLLFVGSFSLYRIRRRK
jgi:hypothetical protein